MRKRHVQFTGLHRLSLSMVVALTCLTPLSTAHAAANAQEAAEIALKNSDNGGKVLGVTQEVDSDGQTIFAVKVLSDGRVRVVRITQTK